MAGSAGFIGVATTALPKRRSIGERRITRPSMQYIRLAENAFARGVTLYLFHPHQVDWGKGKVRAWMPENLARPRGNWIVKMERLPDVVYENVYVHLAMQGYTSELRKAMRMRKIPLYNPVLPGKWRMVEVLRANNMSDFTPQTEHLRSAKQAIERLNQWNVVYVKPIGGYGGMDVARVERLGAGRYRVGTDRTKSQTAHVRMTMTEAELRKWIGTRLRKPQIIQRGLRLISVGGRKVDFRVVLHRDGAGEWQLIGIVPKMAARDGVVTNIIAGGERTDVEQLSALAEREGKRLPLAELERKAKQIAGILSKRYPTMGLVGFDMAVEEDLTVSMIEMNPKPARSLLSKAMLERLAKHTVGFATYLAKRRTNLSSLASSGAMADEVSQLL
ncbi:YheC/YheD family protein [Alicyclobacillus fastidiosus]|uniref:YheC/YheD family protein n=1 Tax=Alicyclobacillus fastidiosus TaxID=392011 RepID=A0ABV5ACQ6_9BACL|nr:YheC/YheD family protein [Alicyclobacillus fastidiosus]WEH11256.1 YheC/YheD family protein [Alicyclobacillus fastidiosus]